MNVYQNVKYTFKNDKLVKDRGVVHEFSRIFNIKGNNSGIYSSFCCLPFMLYYIFS